MANRCATGMATDRQAAITNPPVVPKHTFLSRGVSPSGCSRLRVAGTFELMPVRIRAVGMDVVPPINQGVSTTIAAVFLPGTKGKMIEEIETHIGTKRP